MTRVLPALRLHSGNCLDLFRDVPAHSVDLIVCDPPYGTTAATWDRLLPFAALWPEIERVLTPAGVCLMFASQPFTTDVIASNRKFYRNLWYWKKDRPTGHFLSNRQPMRIIEEVLVFGRTPRSATYNAQTTKRDRPYKHYYRRSAGSIYKPSPWNRLPNGGDHRVYDTVQPHHLLEFARDPVQLIPTQKPVALLRYLIETYTNAGGVVLDPTMGSGSTGVACLETGREFVGFELLDKHFAIAAKRLGDAQAMLQPAPVLDELGDELRRVVQRKPTPAEREDERWRSLRQRSGRNAVA
ncbi:UNVERIFIED_ORG: site-specific DNA-methyltransferase (adenine-specific) [Methylobacterium sp. SuP10 SLI 274]|uniref:DNA-methyltransferase n=1 Tax=Methylorubrum extorquens TaxID=408 RepID=UPI0020A0F51C|nr:site-specific DNA-methyltransferase [Methylorubrum extorquens]MDF9863699.1 site-specific DNA-methyltransferase (adenine-specific) [Methylorubrum pseudosasae]MDH6637301.1 site-specific DNA-methyltransferase (adenine-specific) [Methylobacterium sp. SuP10 SLI 274]MDH6666480.1 site-specific DNA-methyltransferase (adenine-specific) [Methylorubrum zatmanii]MCP1558392.1 DNA modification methylase [Methylorubrum extorquens]MDF9792011.1 site-specific DNA-methyltransferase (adenine-specific) [Methylo